MWTKGMVMLVTGIAGIVITVIWIIVLLVLSSKKRSKSTTHEESGYIPNTSLLTERNPDTGIKSSGIESTELLGAAKKVDTTIILSNKTDNKAPEDTGILQGQVEDTEVLQTQVDDTEVL